MALLMGIAGGSGSGKTTIAKKISASFKNKGNVTIIEMDSYYKNVDYLPLSEREKINYDHPDAMDFELLKHHLKLLSEGKQIEKPVYDFVNHVRSKETEVLESSRIIILEGILAFFDEDIRSLLDIKIFVDTDADIRVLRRIRRDIEVRGRTFDEVRHRYYNFVKPMFHKFVEPTKKFADVVVPEGGSNFVAIDMIVSKIKHWMIEKKFV